VKNGKSSGGTENHEKGKRTGERKGSFCVHARKKRNNTKKKGEGGKDLILRNLNKKKKKEK